MRIGGSHPGQHGSAQLFQSAQPVGQTFRSFEDAHVAGADNFLEAAHGVLGGDAFPAQRGKGDAQLFFRKRGVLVRQALLRGEASGAVPGHVAGGRHKAHG